MCGGATGVLPLQSWSNEIYGSVHSLNLTAVDGQDVSFLSLRAIYITAAAFSTQHTYLALPRLLFQVLCPYSLTISLAIYGSTSVNFAKILNELFVQPRWQTFDQGFVFLGTAVS